MRSTTRRVLDALLAWLGLGDPSDTRLHPTHGWLLPAVQPSVAPVDTPAGGPGTEPGRVRD